MNPPEENVAYTVANNVEDNLEENIQKDEPLARHSTMRLGGTAAYAVTVTTRQAVQAAVAWARDRQLPFRVIGDGSNVFWQDSGFPGLLIINTIGGFSLTDTPDGHVLLTIGSGENWDSVVARSVEQGLTGIEALSLIPGTAGATPVQNVGAYGQDIAQTLVSVDVFDTVQHTFQTLNAADCQLGYRTSRFKTTDNGRFIILSLTLRLAKSDPQPPFYAALQHYFEAHNITRYTPAAVRQAVIAIRSAKLPDPQHVANNGSFFANPIVPDAVYRQLAALHPDLPHWPAADGTVKLSAAWLIEHAGFKDFHDSETGMATWANQPLVLVNERATSTADLLAFKQKIVGAVQDAFGVALYQEPELLP